MTFLFLESRVTGTSTSAEGTIRHVTRTGQAVTLLYLSFFEPDTTFKCMNEIFHVMANPCLDHLFRDGVTGKLKKEFVFIVDNGETIKPPCTNVHGSSNESVKVGQNIATLICRVP